jgi:hypothetical protein
MNERMNQTLKILLKFLIKLGLHLVSMINCNEFFESQKKNFQSLLNQYTESKSGTESTFTFQPDQRQVFGLYTTFVFQKKF